MTKTSKTLAKGALGTVAAGAMALASATPAMAQDRHRDRGIDAGDIIAGALIIGGIAAVASAAGKDRNGYRYRDRNYRGHNGYSRGNPRGAVERCVRAAENRAKRYGYRFADVTQIRDVDDTRYGWRVKGRLVVDGSRGYRGAHYNDRYRYDDRRYGYNDRRGSDRGKFTCYVDRGRVSVDYSGIRGL